MLRKIIYVGLCIILSLVFIYGGIAVSASLIDAKNLVHLDVKEIPGTKQLQLRIKADLMESSYSVDKVESEVQGAILIIKAYKKYVMFVPKEKRLDKLDTVLTIPDTVNEVRFYGDKKAIWSRSRK